MLPLLLPPLLLLLPLLPLQPLPPPLHGKQPVGAQRMVQSARHCSRRPRFTSHAAVGPAGAALAKPCSALHPTLPATEPRPDCCRREGQGVLSAREAPAQRQHTLERCTRGVSQGPTAAAQLRPALHIALQPARRPPPPPPPLHPPFLRFHPTLDFSGSNTPTTPLAWGHISPPAGTFRSPAYHLTPLSVMRCRPVQLEHPPTLHATQRRKAAPRRPAVPLIVLPTPSLLPTS